MKNEWYKYKADDFSSKKPTEIKIMAKEHVTHVRAIIQLTKTIEREKVWLLMN
jgi:hypothetical protein